MFKFVVCTLLVLQWGVPQGEASVIREAMSLLTDSIPGSDQGAPGFTLLNPQESATLIDETSGFLSNLRSILEKKTTGLTDSEKETINGLKGLETFMPRVKKLVSDLQSLPDNALDSGLEPTLPDYTGSVRVVPSHIRTVPASSQFELPSPAVVHSNVPTQRRVELAQPILKQAGSAPIKTLHYSLPGGYFYSATYA